MFQKKEDFVSTKIGKAKRKQEREENENMVSEAAERPKRRERETGREIIKGEMHNLVRIQDVTIMFPTLDVMLVYV